MKKRRNRTGKQMTTNKMAIYKINERTSFIPNFFVAPFLSRKQAWAYKTFIFRTEKKIEISGHFSGHQSHKKRVFLSFRAHIASERLELRLK